MFDQLRRKVTYANVMSTIAVFGVLAGGGAYAVSKIGPSDIAKNAVRTKHIKNNTVKTAKIPDNAVTARKLADGAGGPLAYAKVSGATVQSSKRISQGNLSNPSPGLFCFNGLSFTPRNVVATFVNLGGTIQARLADGVSSACSGAQAQVITTSSGGSFLNVDFMVAMN